MSPEQSAEIEKRIEEHSGKKKKPIKEKVNGLTAIYEKIMVQDGKNLHTFEAKPLNEKIYEESRFVQSRSLSDRLYKRIRFLVVYKGEDMSTAVTLREPTKITSDLLYIAQSSNTLGNALRELFKKPFGLGFGKKKLLFIFIIAVVGALIYLVYTGQLKIPGL